MGQFAYILLCHKNVDAVIAQAEQLTAPGDAVAIHYDARAPKADYARLQAELAANDRVVFCETPGEVRLGRVEPCGRNA